MRCALCGSADAETVASGLDYEYATLPDEFHFVRCRACDHQYLNPRPSVADLPVIYPPHYYAYSEGGSRWSRGWKRNQPLFCCRTGP